MNPKLFERVTKLFDAVRQLPPAERTAHLDAGSGGDEELRSEVESLLAHHDAASGLLSESALADPVPSEPQREELVAKIAVEYCDRLDRGESPDIDAIARRHPPEVSDVVRRTLGALKAVHSLRAEDVVSVGDDALGDDADPRKSRKLGDFRIVREIGRGGMGVVFEAQQLSLNRRVALKVLPLAAVLDPRQLQRFKNEAQAAALLHHQNIVPVHGVGSARGVHYYAMQYIEGHNLAEVIRDLRRLEGLDEPIEAAAGASSPNSTIGRSLASGEFDPHGRPSSPNELTADYTPQFAASERAGKRHG